MKQHTQLRMEIHRQGGVDVTDQVVKDGNLCTLTQKEKAGKAVLQVNWQ